MEEKTKKRPIRVTTTALQKQQEDVINHQLTQHYDTGLPLEIKGTNEKGRGVFTCIDFQKGDFVVEYAGELVTLEEAKNREMEYEKDPSYGSYMYYFTNDNKSYCVDATEETGRLGRLVNHSKKRANLKPKVHTLNRNPHIIFLASRHIKIGEELLFDYGDKSKYSIKHHPWLLN